jgi:integrase
VRDRLPVEVQPVVTFAYLTGWRIKSEVLPIQWSRIDMNTGSVRLDPGITKNDKGRAFPFTKFPELAEIIQRQRKYTSAVEREKRTIIPWVFHRNGAPINDFRGAWKPPALSSSFQRERAKQERLEGLAAVKPDANPLKDGAGDRDRTGTGLSAHGILSPKY